MSYKHFFFVWLLTMAAINLSAAGITGSVSDRANGQPMAYVTISLLDSDSALVDGTITDEQGRYTLAGTYANHTYILSASFVGYKTEYRQLTLPIAGEQEGALSFLLSEETEQLQEVEVKAKRPLVERQMDKLVLNVSASPFAIGSNGQDVLKKAPGVRIDQDGNITVNGKSVEVYIDGRPSYMSGEQLKGLLQGTAGASIEKIEIITNPSAKYDASGQGGIINIKLKKNMMQGLNGMLAANYGGMYFKNPITNNTPSPFWGKGAQRAGKGSYYQNDYVTLNLNYRSSKTYTSLNLTQVYAKQGVEFSSYSQQPLSPIPFPQKGQGECDTLRFGSDLHYDLHFQYYNLRATNDWYIDNKNTLGVILNVPIMKTNMSAYSVGEYGTYTMLGDQLVNQSYTKAGQRMFSPQHSANLNFTHTFADSCSQELTANLDYNRFNSHSLNYQFNSNTVTVPGYEAIPALHITTDQAVNIYSAKVDFQSGFLKKGFVETGIKYALSATDNEMVTDSTKTQTQTITQTKGFNYREHVAALYCTASWQFNEKLSVKAGLRGEYTYGVGDWKMEGVDNYRNSRFDLFPTAFIGYNPAKDWRMSASYTRRIKRPSYYQLNPFRTYISTHAYQEGNPELQPEFNNQVDLTVGWSQYISLSANFAHTESMMHQKGEVLPNGDMRNHWINFGTCTTHGVSLSLTEIPVVPKLNDEGHLSGAWLALTLNGGYYNFISRAYTGDYVERSHYANCNGTLTAYLPKDIQIALDGWYSAPMTIGYDYSRACGAMGFAFKKTFPKQQLTMSLNVNDLLRSTKFWQETKGLAEGYVSRVSQEVHQQSISIGLTYMFGQHQWHKWRNVGNTDESSRLGGGGSVGSK